MSNRNEKMYKIYEDGKDRCVELENGKFRAIEHKGNSFEVNTYDQKPSRFQQHRIMTTHEIFDAGLFRLFNDVICANDLLEGASTLGEAIQKLYDFADFLEGLARDGWFLIKDFENHHGRIIIGMKSEDD